jgi:hypothetical protein
MDTAYRICGMQTYMWLNFMKFRILICILNINIYNSSLTLNKYEMWCGGLALGSIQEVWGSNTIQFSKSFEVF